MTNFSAASTERQCVYIVFTRTPLRGRVKTRLAADIGEESTLLLYEAMLEDTLRNVCSRLLDERSPVSEAFVFAFPPETREKLQEWIERRIGAVEGLRVEAQEGATLGERMERAFVWVFRANPQPTAIIIGTDSPFVEQEIFAQAEAALAEGKAAIGRADDGGFYIMGLPFVEQSFFFGDEYGNDSVYRRTLDALRPRANVVELPARGDIDDLASLREQIRLHSDLLANAFQTLRVGRDIVQRHGRLRG